MLPFLLWLVAAPAQVTDEEIERLTDGIVELRSRLATRYFALPEAAAFFRRAGPFAGCDAYNELLTRVSDRHYPAFRTGMIGAYRRSLPPDLLSAAQGGRFASAATRARLVRYRPQVDRSTSPETNAAAEEFAAGMRRWLAAAPSDRPKGVNRAGKPFWGNNIVAVRLICAVRGRDRESMLAGWMKE
jgi:hypothetical protein